VSTTRVLLTPEQIEKLARELVEELHKIPLYDVDSKRRLASEYLRKVQTIIRDNIIELPDNEPNSVKAVIACNMLVD